MFLFKAIRVVKNMKSNRLISTNATSGWRPEYYTSQFLDLSLHLLKEDAVSPSTLLNSNRARFMIYHKGKHVYRITPKHGDAQNKNGGMVNIASAASTPRESDKWPEGAKLALLDCTEVKELLHFSPHEYIGGAEERNNRSDAEYANTSNFPIVAFIGNVHIRAAKQIETAEFMDAFSSAQTSEHWTHKLWYFAIDISHLENPMLPQDKFHLQKLRFVSHTYINREISAILGRSNGLMLWHRQNLYCSKCGSKMEPQEYGLSKTCSSKQCGAVIFPRQDPAVIVLVVCGEYCLLGRKTTANVHFYSTLAGFVEMGEAVEQTVHREVLEEAGVKVNLESLRYISSQPWLFPQSFMIGIIVDALDLPPAHPLTESEEPISINAPTTGGWAAAVNGPSIWLPFLHCHDEELEDAKWFHYTYVNKYLNENSILDANIDESKGILMPGKNTIAHSLIRKWVDQKLILTKH